eukprot:m.261813 g.261813  ORF g.261813 m.261813 type:complete len:77 (-) comp46246_c0_seq1:182-412(-)
MMQPLCTLCHQHRIDNCRISKTHSSQQQHPLNAYNTSETVVFIICLLGWLAAHWLKVSFDRLSPSNIFSFPLLPVG